jgi:hypothetical protein
MVMGPTWAFRLLCAGFGACTFSLPLGRLLLAGAFAAGVVEAIRTRRRPQIPIVAWLALAFVAVACVVTLTGPNASIGGPKLGKLAWFGVMLPAAWNLATHRNRRTALGWFAVGSSVLALQVVVGNTTRALLATRAAAAAGNTADFLWELTDRGGMTDGQMLMLGLLATLGFLFAQDQRRRGCWWGLLALQIAGLILNFKRGSWICAVAMTGLLLALRMRWRVVLAVGLAVACTAALPPVWNRLSGLRAELTTGHGGRLVMWTQIAPELHRRQPWGVGFRALTSAMMQDAARARGVTVEAGRNHLHANLIQVWVAVGWLGLALYLAWMTWALRDGIRGVRLTWGSPDAEAALIPLLMFGALLLNGLVEYNFADAELVLVYGVLMGAMAAASQRA